jgi:hypothetical protein
VCVCVLLLVMGVCVRVWDSLPGPGCDPRQSHLTHFPHPTNPTPPQVIAATNRIDTLDPALLRSGRLDRKIEFPLPNEEGRARIMQIHSRKMSVSPDVNFEELARCCDEFNGAQCKAVCVEAGMIAVGWALGWVGVRWVVAWCRRGVAPQLMLLSSLHHTATLPQCPITPAAPTRGCRNHPRGLYGGGERGAGQEEDEPPVLCLRRSGI